MHRRKIVVDGTTYGWCTTSDGRAMVVFPPKGKGGPVRFEVPRDDHEDHDPFRECATPVTPRMVADNIHCHFLRVSPVPRTAPARRKSPVRMEATWETSHEVPRAHVVSCSLAAAGMPGMSVPLEAHVDAGTAMESARDLARAASGVPAHYASLRAWHGCGSTRRRPTYRAGRTDGGRAFPGLEDWLDRCLEAGAPTVEPPAFTVSPAPLLVPGAPAPVDRWSRGASREARAERSLSRLTA